MTLDELDRLAAEKVMCFPLKIYEGRPHWDIGSSIIPSWEWQPTRDIAQAWELLEKMDMDTKNILWDSGWSCSLYYGETQFMEYGHTASEAIVRACLRAKGVEV